MAGTGASGSSQNDGWLSHILDYRFLFGLGVVTGIIWFTAFNAQIFTNGVGMLVHEGASHSMPFPFWIWDQITLLANNTIPDSLRMALISALFVQFVQLIVSLGVGAVLQVVHSQAGIHLTPALSKEAAVRNFIFGGAALLIFVIDAVFDWSYGPGDLGAHALFTLAVDFCSFFFLPLTVMIVRAAIILKQA